MEEDVLSFPKPHRNGRKTYHEATTKETTQLRTDRAFVVQLTASTVISREHIAGRIEHVVSGQSTHFQSLEGLLAFIAQVFGEKQETENPL